MSHWQLTFDELPPGLNGGRSKRHPDRQPGLLRMHWTQRKELNERWVSLVRAQLAEVPEQPLYSRSRPVHLEVLRVGRRLLDWDNLGASLKPVLDGLQCNRILDNDSPAVVRSLTLAQETGKPARLVLTFITLEEALP